MKIKFSETIKENLSRILKNKIDLNSFNHPWEYLNVLDKIKDIYDDLKLNGFIEIKDRVLIGENCKIKPCEFDVSNGPVIIANNSEIGPFANFRGPVIVGNNCKVGNFTEVKNAIILDNSNAPHHNYVGDTIMGQNCNLGAGTKLANVRHDMRNVIIRYKEEKFDTGRMKFGAILENNVKTGCNVVTNPGTYLCENVGVLPNESVKGFIELQK